MRGSKLRLKSTEGEIVEVQGGHVVRSLGRRDRHSKVCTSKGLRDRRVRLSAHTAIQFYDVQDRLGCDRPSKAIDWLIEKAKTSIDALAELRMPNPTATTITTSPQQTDQDLTEQSHYDLQHHGQRDTESETVTGSNSGFPQQTDQDLTEQSHNDLQHHGQRDAESETVTGSNSGLNSGYDIQNRQHLDHIPIKSLSFFSIGDATPSSLSHLENYPSEQTFFSASTPLVSNATPTSWFDRQRSEMNPFQRMIACNWDTGNGGEEYVFNSLPRSSVFSQDQLFSKREPLQSSNLPSIRALMNLPISTNDHCQTLALNPSSTSGIGFASDEYSGFQILAQIHGDEEEQNAVSN